jgi:hypothetical protein
MKERRKVISKVWWVLGRGRLEREAKRHGAIDFVSNMLRGCQEKQRSRPERNQAV